MSFPNWSTDDEHAVERVHSERRSLYLSRSVAITGFMGAGKSSIGRRVAAGLERPFRDVDSVIEGRSGQRISELFATRGEAAFRDLEAEVTAEIANGPVCVMSLGGGALGRDETRELLIRRCLVVHLHVPWSVLRQQLPRLRRSRPVLGDRSETEIHELYLRRQRDYRSAHLRINVPRDDIAAATDQVLAMVGGPAAVSTSPRRR